MAADIHTIAIQQRRCESVRAQFPSFLRQDPQFRLTASPHDVKPDAADPGDMVEVPVSSPAQTLKVDVPARCWPWTAAAQS